MKSLLLLTGILIVVLPVRAQPPCTQISDTRYGITPTVPGPWNGTITVSLGYTISPTDQSVALITVASGVVSICLPAGNYTASYAVKRQAPLTGSVTFVRYWQVPPSGPVTVGTIETTTAPTPFLAAKSTGIGYSLFQNGQTAYIPPMPFACTITNWNVAGTYTAQTISISIASPAVVTLNSFSTFLSTTYPIVLSTTGALPGGLTAATLYYAEPIASNSISISIASPSVITWNGSNLAAGTRVTLTTNGALPTGFSPGNSYYVVSPTTNTFELSLTSGGAAINTSGTQSGTQTATLTDNFELSNTLGGGAINTSGSQSGTQTAYNETLIDVWKVASGSALPTVANSITGGALPNIITGNASTSSSLGSWSTQTVNLGDIIAFNLTSSSQPSAKMSIVLGCQR